MIGVIADVRLKQDLFFFPGQSATIDEVPYQMTHFSDVSVCGNGIATRQHKSRVQFGICFEHSA